MAFVKKHPFFLLWIAGIGIGSLAGLPLVALLLGSLAYWAAAALLRFSRSAFWLGYLLQGVLNQPETAFRLYTFAFRHGAAVPRPMNAYAMLLIRKGQYPQALAVLQKVQTLPAPDPETHRISLQNLALAYEKTGDLPRAIETMERLREGSDYLPGDFYTTLAYFHIEAGDLDKAEQINALALEDGRCRGACYDNQGLIAYRRGDLEQAESLFRQALDIDGSMISPKYYLGLIAQARGDTAAAGRYFRQVHDAGLTGLNTLSPEEAEEAYRRYGSVPEEETL